MTLHVLPEGAQAQQVIVQQPRVQVFSLDSAVSVPDRGSVFLGGVSGGASGSQVYGPLRWGTAWGQEFQSSMAWSHVWIHDFEAMDAAVLEEARRRDGVRRFSADRSAFNGSPAGRSSPALLSPVSEQAARARQQLLERSTR